MKKASATALACLVLVLAAGCARVPVEKRFSTFRDHTSQRTGHSVEWHGISKGEQAVLQTIDDMLEEPLHAGQAVHIALLNNRRLQATYAEFGIALADLVQAGLPPNPVAEVIIRVREDSSLDLRTWEYVIVQDFLDVVLIPLKRKMREAQFEQSKLRIEREIISLATQTRVGFYGLQAAEQRLAKARSALLASEAAYEMAAQYYKAGNFNTVVLLTERASYEQTKLAVAAEELQVYELRESLNRTMGLWGNRIQWTVAPRLPALPESELDLADMEQRAVDASLDLAAAWRNIEAVARRQGIRNVETVVTELAIGAELERETEVETELGENVLGEPRLESHKGPDIWWRGTSVAIPIPLFDQGQAVRTRGRLRVRQEWEHFTALAIDLRSVVRLARYRLQYARNRVSYYDEVVLPVQQRLRAQAQLRYNGMFIGVFGLLEAKTEELQAERNYIGALRDYWVARARAEQLLLGVMPTDAAPRDMGAATGMAAGNDGEGGH